MAETTRTKTSAEGRPGSRGTLESAPEPAATEDAHPAPTCTVGFCPICLAVTAVQPLRPDVLEHLLNAGREFLLAARSVLDARATAVDGQEHATRLEKIDIG